MAYGEVSQNAITPPQELIPDLAPIESIIMGKFRGSLILEQAKSSSSPPAIEEVMGHDACADAHDNLLSRHQAAETRFLEALGEPHSEAQEHSSIGHTATKRSHLLLEQKSEADIVHRVEVVLNSRGEICSSGSPVKISTFLLQKLTHGPESIRHVPSAVLLHGNYEGHFAIADDTLARYTPSLEELKPSSFADIRQSLTAQLEREGRCEALSPYAAQLAGRQDFSEGQEVDLMSLANRGAVFGLYDRHEGFKPITRLLLQNMKSTEQALDVLHEAFTPDNFVGFFRVLTQPLDSQQEELVKRGAIKRFSWLTQKLTEMREKANEGARKRVIFGFAAAYEQQASAEAVKTERIKALAQKYEAMENIGPFGPESWRS